MTIALALKVGDGVVLGADSAGTLVSANSVENVYFNAEKIVNLVKGLPLGMVAYGLGGLGGRSVAAVAKDLREQFTAALGPRYVDPTNYTVERVAQEVKTYFYDDLYQKDFAAAAEKPAMGLLVAGFSAQSTRAEIWTIEVDEHGQCTGPALACGEAEHTILWFGQPEALNRLINGWSFDTLHRLLQAGMNAPDAKRLLDAPAPLHNPAMPIQDAIDLVVYLAEVTAGFVRFHPGAPTVAPPIDVAAITRHEKFRWVRRKHYYSRDLNPA